MRFVDLIIRAFNKLKSFWNYKIFRIAIILHSFYFILGLILFFVFYYEKNDFFIFYESGKVFLFDIENLYNQTYYLWDFRYFPLSALFFIPFSFLDFGLAFILFNIINFILNILISLMLYKIIILIRGKDHEKDDKRIILYLSVYLMGLPHILNYIYGQINLFITFFILSSILIFISRKGYFWQFLASLILGISVIIKPTSLFMIPFLLLTRFERKKWRIKISLKESIIRIFGVLLPVFSNSILFLIFPKLWNGFLSTNLTGSNPTALNFSFSFTKLITNFCYFFNIPFSQLYILISFVLIFGSIGFISFLLRSEHHNSIIFGYTLGIIIMLLTYFDSWNHHLLNLIPLLIIILFTLPRKSEIVDYIKPSLFFFSFFDLVFLGMWFLTYPIFPYNFGSTFFLLITFIGIIIYLARKEGG
ncbi:MAG: DUF2029 domain-containing protein [Candidatus Lokiarchaeota archaeon]|nr:DUF2029 domain-containing protein [Candidatus Lokiarchaeota archaeon]